MQNVVATSWSEISSTVLKLNKNLHDVIDSYPQLQSHDLHIYKYPYGSTVGDDLFFYGPASSNIKKNIIPFSMVLDNYFEMPIEIIDKIIPWKIYKPGDVFPYTRFHEVNKLHEPTGSLSMTAGSKSSFLLINNISDKKWHNLLCNKYNINVPPPKNFSDHFQIFKALSESTNNDWRASLLIFSESFFKEAEKIHDFKEMIFNTSLKEKLFRSNLYAYDALLDLLFKKSIVSSGFVEQCLRNIFYIGCGDRPSHFCAIDDKFGPHSLFIEAYIEGFKSKSCPIFMVSDFFNPFHTSIRSYFSLNNLNYLTKPDKISSQAKIITAIFDGFQEINSLILNSNFSPDSIFFMNSKKLKIEKIIKNDDYFLSNIENDDLIMKTATRYNLPIPFNSTFLSSCLALKYDN